MVDDIPATADFIQKLAIFRGISRDQVEFIAARLEMVSLAQGEKLFTQGQRGDAFYIILDGKVCISQLVGKRTEEIGTLVCGDYYGEESLLMQKPRSVSATAEEPTRVLLMDRSTFNWMIRQYPQIKLFLLAAIETRRLSRKNRFPWLGQDETTYIIAQKGFAYLLFDLIVPLAVGWFAVIFFFLSIRVGVASWRIVFELAGGVLVLIGVGWGIWRYIDWQNDFYIVTNRRVVWIEKIVGLYDSRQEAPLTTVLTVGIQRDQLGRMFGFGDVVVRTYTSQLSMPKVGYPDQLVGLIEEQVERANQASHKQEMAALEQTIRRRLGLEPPEPPKQAPLATKKKKPGFLQRLFRHFFTMRYEEGGVVTFRKHWILLVGKIWFPSLCFLLTCALLYLRLANIFTMFTTTTIVAFCLLLFVITICWWFYRYLDWSNDIYQVTKDQIIDIYRVPLGREDKKTAQLENIISLDYERNGAIGLLFNFGNVIAAVGATKFTFIGVFNPASVQQEVFEHMNRRKKAMEEAKVIQERERIADWLTAYYNQIDGKKQIPPNFDQNTR